MPPVVAAVAAIATAIASATGVSVGIVTAVLTSGIIAGAQMGLNAIMSAFKHPASTKSGQAGTQLLTREPISFRRIVYGTIRASGIITDVFIDNLAASVNVQLHLVVTLAGHQVQSISNSNIYIDGVTVPLGLGGDGAYHPSSGPYAAHMYVEFDNGDPANSAQPFPLLNTDNPAHWTANHKQQGCAKVHIRLLWDANIFSNGMPQAIAFDIQGKKVFDPRTGLTAFSNNSALCVRDWLTDSEYGFGASAANIDDATIIAAANICDELVSKKAGGTQARYTCDGAVTSDVPRGDVLTALLSSMAGYIIPPGESWRLFAGAYTTPVLTLTDDDLRGPIKYDTRVAQRDLYNGVKGTYVSPTNNWQPSDFTPYQSAAYVLEDGDPVWNDITFDFTTDDIRAQRLAKINLELSRRQNSLLLQCKLTAFPLQPGDVFEFTHDHFAFTNKTFMVVHTNLTTSGSNDDVVIGVDVTCIPIDSSVYAWTPSTDEGTTTTPNTTVLPDMGTVPALTGLTLSNVEVTRADGIKHLQIHAQWTQSTDSFVLLGGKVQVWIAPHGGTFRLAGECDGSDTDFYISSNVNDGSSYDVEVCAVNSHGIQSPFTAVNNFLATATNATFAGTVSSLDNVNDGTAYLRAPQFSALSVQNGNFEASASLLPPPGWKSVGASSLAYDTATPHSGSQSIKFTASGGSGLVSAALIKVVPGEQYKISSYAKRVSGSGTVQVYLGFFNAAGVDQGSAATQSTTSGAWTLLLATGTVPANAVYAQIQLIITGASSVAEFDDVVLVRVSSLDDEVQDGITYARPLSSRLSAGKPLIDFAETIHLNKTIDSVADGGTYLRTTYFAGDAIIENGSFESSATILPPPGYDFYANTATLSYDTSTQFSGSRSIKISTPPAGGGGIRPTKQILCRPGDVVFASARAKVVSGSGNARVSISFRTASGSGVGGADALTASAAWVLVTNTQTAPAGTVFATFELYADAANTVVEFDEHYVRCVRNLDTEVTDGFSRFAQTAGGLTYRPTSNPLTATDAGSNDTVSIAAFTMRCTGHTDVSVSSGSITALSRSTLYYIYYDDPTLAGGAVTFNATTTKETALNGAGRFFVGSITTPAASGAATVGNNDGGVGAQGGCTSIFLFGAAAVNITPPATSIITAANTVNCFDGDTSTFAQINKVVSLTGTADGQIVVSGMSPSSAPWQSLTLKIRTGLTISGASITGKVQYSLDGGVSFPFTVYTTSASRGITVDSVALPVKQNLAQLRVRADLSTPSSTGSGELDFYEAWVEGVE